jgi:hypothetical protein
MTADTPAQPWPWISICTLRSILGMTAATSNFIGQSGFSDRSGKGGPGGRHTRRG